MRKSLGQIWDNKITEIVEPFYLSTVYNQLFDPYKQLNSLVILKEYLLFIHKSFEASLARKYHLWSWIGFIDNIVPQCITPLLYRNILIIEVKRIIWIIHIIEAMQWLMLGAF